MQVQEVVTKTKWIIDPAHSHIGFRVRHLMISNVKGSFKEFDASIYTTGDEFITAEIDFWLYPASVDTGNEQRDTHLRSADFFDADQFKEIHFTSNSVANLDNSRYELYGELTMKE